MSEEVSNIDGCEAAAILVPESVSTASTVYQVGSRYGDALVLSPYNESDYSKEIIITTGPNRESANWKPATMPAGAFIAGLCKHLEGTKDGRAFVTGDMVPGRRYKASVKALYGVGLDIDTGTPVKTIDAALLKLGCLAVRYSTHSAYTTRTDFKKDTVFKFAKDREIDADLIRDYLREVEQWDSYIVENAEYLGTDHTEKGIVCQVEHPPIPKHRIVVLFEEPFVIENEGRTQAEAMAKWTKVPEALAGLLGVPFDATGTDPSRLFYFPRHSKTRPFDISLFGGPYFDWRTLELEGSGIERVVANLGKGKSKSVSDEGRALGRWSLKRSHGFQIADVIEARAPDRIRHNTGHGLEIECPHDEDHSNAGDPEDRACLVVNAGEGPSEFFTISCRHESCRNKTNLDMLGKMIRDGWFGEDVLESEEFNAILEESEKPAVAVKIEKQDEAKKTYQDAIEALTKESSGEEVDTVIRMMLEAGLKKIDIARAEGAIKAKLGRVGIADVRAEVSRVRSEFAKEQDAQTPHDDTTTRLVKELSVTLGDGKTFNLPPRYLGRFSLDVVERKIWLFMGPDRLCTPFMVEGGITFKNRGAKRGLRVAVLNQRNTWTRVEIDPADLAGYGTSAVGELMRYGLAVTEEGKRFVVDLLSQSQLDGPTVCDRPGFHGDAFICPTGQVLLTKERIELAKEKGLKCEHTKGEFDRWLEGVKGIFELPIEDAYQFQAGILIGLAGTLANLAGDETLIFPFTGPPSTGKSTAQALGVANWCDGDLVRSKGDGLFVSAKGTPNSHEAFFERMSGTVGALDEFGQHLKAEEQVSLVFMVQSGQGKRRLDSNSRERDVRYWEGGALTFSAEKDFAERVRAEAVNAPAGLWSRMFPISTDQVKDYGKSLPDCVTIALANFGHAGPEFVKALAVKGRVADRDKVKSDIAELDTGRDATTGAYENRGGRAARYLRAAGHFIQDLGWVAEGFQMDALMDMLWADSLASESGVTDPFEKAWQVLCDNCTARKDSDIVPLQMTEEDKRSRGYKEAVGYYDTLTGRYILRATKFDELAGRTVSGKKLREWMDGKTYLIRSPKADARTWSGYPGLGKDAQYVVIAASAVNE